VEERGLQFLTVSKQHVSNCKIIIGQKNPKEKVHLEDLGIDEKYINGSQIKMWGIVNSIVKGREWRAHVTTVISLLNP
jgi:hypothetical protein